MGSTGNMFRAPRLHASGYECAAMRWRRKRTGLAVNELIRVKKILEGDLAARRCLGPKKCPVRKRTGGRVSFAPEVVAVAQAMISQKAQP